VVDVEIAVVVCVDDIRTVIGDFGFDGLDDVQQRDSVETVVGEPMEADSCTESVSCLLGSLSTLFDFRVGSVGRIVARGHTVREDTDVDIIAIGSVSSECATDTEYFVVRVSDNTEYGHTYPYLNQLYRWWEFTADGSYICEWGQTSHVDVGM